MFESIFRDKVSQMDLILKGNIPEPDMCNFLNIDTALDMLKQSIQDNKYVLIHCDIDMDGIGSGYIMYRFFQLENCIHKVRMLINKERSHGINQKFVDLVNSTSNIGLVVVLDSSSNEIELIKQINTNVLVIDHHNIDHTEYKGLTGNGRYTIINNIIPNFNYEPDKRMSAGLVVYELLRHYYNGGTNKLEYELMFNWVAVTLITDAILLDNPRNQYYLERSLDNDNIEPHLKVLIEQSKQASFNKNTIQYYVSPRINSAIRAKESAKALQCVIFEPLELNKLIKYKEIQMQYLQSVDIGIYQADTFILKDITNLGISKAYCGVLASRLCTKYRKNVAVYVVEDGVCKGSFRGRCEDVNYIEYFKSKAEFAGGHNGAFGFRVLDKDIEEVMRSLIELEPVDKREFYITAGDMPDNIKGKYHIEDTSMMDKFKKERHLLNLSILNSRLSTQEAINIIVLNHNLEYTVDEFGLYKYSLLGIKAKSFNEITTQYAALYIEYANGIQIYIKDYYIQ